MGLRSFVQLGIDADALQFLLPTVLLLTFFLSG